MCDDINAPGCYRCHANGIEKQRPISFLSYYCWPVLACKSIKQINTSHSFIINMVTIRVVYVYLLLCLLTLTFYWFCWFNLVMVRFNVNNFIVFPLNNTKKFIQPWIIKTTVFPATTFEDWRENTWEFGFLWLFKWLWHWHISK